MSEHATSSPGKWRPILEGKLRERALDTVRSIAAGLEQPADAKTPRYAMQLAEQSLFNAYLGFSDLGDHHFDLSSKLLESAIDAVAETPMRPALYGGFVGVAWVLEHLQSHELSTVEGDDAEDVDPNEQVDSVLHEYLGVERWGETYDLISGLTGVGVY